MANNLTWKAYRDGNRIIIGPVEWQNCMSMTFGIVEVYADESAARDIPKLLRRARVTSLARCEALKRLYWTDARFEAACDAGAFGSEW